MTEHHERRGPPVGRRSADRGRTAAVGWPSGAGFDAGRRFRRGALAVLVVVVLLVAALATAGGVARSAGNAPHPI